MKITAFAATNNTESINLELIKSTLIHFPAAQVNILDLNDYEMPIFSPKRSLEGIPSQAQDFSNALEQSDILIIGLAEYNGTFTSAFKNIFDWTSKIDMKVFKDKPTLLLSTSPGPRGATTVLESAKNIFPFYGAQVIESFSLPSFYDNFKDGNIEDQDLKQALHQTMESFKNKLVSQEVE
ncbi:NADPH-dependent FMN reductase [Myroides sp. LJL116]